MGWLSRLFGTASAPDVAPAPPQVIAPLNLDFVAIDVETACSRNSSICQVGIVGFLDGKEVLTFESLVDPRDEFDPFNVGLHGIDRHHVRGKPHFGHLHETLAGHLGGRIAVAHSSFDRGALSAAALQHRKPEIEARWLDSVAVARRAWPDLPNHKLKTMADHLGINFKHHDALNDARTAGLVVLRASEETGLSLKDWFAAPRKPRSKAPVARPGGSGPLAGECVCMTGDMSVPKPKMADEIAAAGGSVTSTVSGKTTILVLGHQDVSTFAGKDKSAKHIKAEVMNAAGHHVRIMVEHEFRMLLARTG